MRIRWGALAVAMGLAACAPFPFASPVGDYAVQSLPALSLSASADSALGGCPAVYAVDGNQASLWASGVYQSPSAWLRLALAHTSSLSAIAIKTPPEAGTSFDVQTTTDGSHWNTVLAHVTNTSWGLETKSLPSGTQASAVRLLWHNRSGSPWPRFQVYEVQVYGTAASGVNSWSNPGAPPGAGSGVTLPSGTWRNAVDDGYAYPWLVRGSWSLSGATLTQTGTDWPWYGGAPPLSFMRYASGALPARYAVDVVLQVRGCNSRDPYYPIGDTGVQVYYLNPTHYVEVVYRPHTFEIWQCNGGVPYQYSGWTLLGRYVHASSPWANLHVHAEVDTLQHRLVVQLPDGGSTAVYAPLATNQPHWMSLRASNAQVWVESVRLNGL